MKHQVQVGRRSVEVDQTITDRVVGFFSPRAAAERLKARTFLALAGGGYDGGRRDKRSMRRWRMVEQSANADTIPDLPDLRARSRDLVRNTPVATGALATVVTNVVGDGLSLMAQVDRDALELEGDAADEWQEYAQREWEVWCRTCDFTRQQNFYELQALAYRSMKESGDVLVVRRFRKDLGDTYGTKLQLIEADRICNPHRAADNEKITGGVEVDGDGVTIAYWVASRPPMEFGMTSGKPLEWKRVPARDPDTGQLLAFMLFERIRVDLIRGVPWLAPVVETVKQLGNYTTAEAQAAVVGAYFTVFVTSPAVVNAEDQTMVGSNESRDVDDPAKEARLEDPGAIIELNSGQEVSTAAPGRPNTAFDGFVSSLCQHIGVALELPYELVIKRFQASYSASRAALETAWQFFRKQRSLFAWRFCQTAYEWMMEEAVASGRIVADGFFDDAVMREAWLGADWIGPSRINLDPKKESDADMQDIELGVKTRQQVVTERTGGTFEQKTRQLVKEQAARKELAPPEPKPGAAKADPPSGNPDLPEQT
jgi:lambda family phage portal protein